MTPGRFKKISKNYILLHSITLYYILLHSITFFSASGLFYLILLSILFNSFLRAWLASLLNPKGRANAHNYSWATQPWSPAISSPRTSRLLGSARTGWSYRFQRGPAQVREAPPRTSLAAPREIKRNRHCSYPAGGPHLESAKTQSLPMFCGWPGYRRKLNVYQCFAGGPGYRRKTQFLSMFCEWPGLSPKTQSLPMF
jgi:hypothetical protein